MARSEKMITISPSRLRYAREYYGLTINDVCLRLKTIKCEDLKNYENGVDFPSYSKLEALASLYNRPLLYFFFKSAPTEDKLYVAFRSVENQTGRILDMQIRTMIEKADWYRQNLSDIFQNNPPVRFTELLWEDKIDTGEKLLCWLREKIELSIDKQKKEFVRVDRFLEYIREQLYNIGIYIFKDSFKSDDVSGLCLYDNNFPVILLNNKTSFTRQVFTIFHEVYHLFCKEADVYYPNHNEEKECDRFASEFLIPSNDFALKLSNYDSLEDENLIEDLAKEYNVSPSAIAYRLLSQGKISKEFYLSIQEDGIRKVNSATSGGNFYFTKMSYLGRPYLKKVFSEYYSGKISVITVGKYTGLKTSHISKLTSNMFGGVL